MLALQEMIKKFLFLGDSSSPTLSSNLDASSKAHLATKSFSKALTERWNQANLGYFDSHLDKVHGKDGIVSIRKDVYYNSIVLFVEYFQSLVTY